MKLLIKDPENRLGAQGGEQVKAHSLFENVDWDSVENKIPVSPLAIFE